MRRGHAQLARRRSEASEGEHPEEGAHPGGDEPLRGAKPGEIDFFFFSVAPGGWLLAACGWVVRVPVGASSAGCSLELCFVLFFWGWEGEWGGGEGVRGVP